MKCTPLWSKLYHPDALGAAAVALAVEPHIIVEDVVLARDVVNVEARLGDDAIGVVELGRLGEMRDVAGMNDERRFRRQRARSC